MVFCHCKDKTQQKMYREVEGINKTVLIITLQQFYKTLITASDDQKSKACRMLHANGEAFLAEVPDRCFLQIAKSWEEALKETLECLKIQEEKNCGKETWSKECTEAIGISVADFGTEHKEKCDPEKEAADGKVRQPCP